MTFCLYVDGSRWRAHTEQVRDAVRAAIGSRTHADGHEISQVDVRLGMLRVGVRARPDRSAYRITNLLRVRTPP